MNATGAWEPESGCVVLLDGPFPLCQEDDEEEPIQTSTPPDEPVEAEPDPDAAEPGQEDWCRSLARV